MQEEARPSFVHSKPVSSRSRSSRGDAWEAVDESDSADESDSVDESDSEDCYPSGGGPAIPTGGGPTGPGSESGSGPSGIVSRLVRGHPEWDDRWSVPFEERLASNAEAAEALQRAQTNLARFCAILDDDHDRRVQRDEPTSLIMHLLDDFGTAAIVRFGDTPSFRVSLPNALQVLKRSRDYRTGSAAEVAFRNFEETDIESLGNLDLFEKMPIPIVLLPEPRWEPLTSALQAINVKRGDALEIDARKFISVGTCAEIAGVRGVVTVEHGVRAASLIVHSQSGVTLDASSAITNRIWDAAWIPLSPTLSWEPRDGMPAPVRCARYREAPGRGLRCSYHGAATNYQTTFVDGADPLLPHFSESDVARIYTARITEPGDSGALLVDVDGRAIGMARSRTEDDYIVPMSLWTYFPGVLYVLKASL